MNNRELRLLTDIIKQQHSVKKTQTISDLLFLDLGIYIDADRIEKIPSLKQTLFREVITTNKKGNVTLAKVIKYRSNVQK